MTRSIAEVYHQGTKYFEEEIGRHQQLDWSAQPVPFKEYQSEKRIDLTPYLPFSKSPFTGRPLEPPAEQEGPITLGEISRLLYFTNGVTGIVQFPAGQSLYLRAAPSAGGLYPTEIYVAVRDLPALPDGIYNFQVKDHSLVLVWEGNFWEDLSRHLFGQEAVSVSRLLFLFTGIYYRSAWRYRERAYRRILLDTGHVLGNLLCCAPLEGLEAHPIAGFYDDGLNRLLFLDEEQEGILAAVPMTRPGEASRRNPARPSPLIKEAAATDLLRQIHLASRIPKMESGELILPQIDYPENQCPQPSPTLLTRVPINWREEGEAAQEEEAKEEETMTGGDERGIARTILMRRSTRAFSAEPFLADELGALLAYAYAGLSDLPHSGLFDPTLLLTYVVVQRSVGIEPGVYYYAPGSHSLRPIRHGDFIPQTAHFCLGQELARDAAAVVIHTADLPRAIRLYGDRAYRYLHLDAGQIGERLNLAAIRLGLGASGIGGFYDDEVNALLGRPLEEIVVYVTTLGRRREP